jgi:hypothetical protein
MLWLIGDGKRGGTALEKRFLQIAISVAAVAVLALGIWQRGSAAGIEPGSDADPLVTQSYVDPYVKLQVVSLSPGDRLIPEGGAEVILRAGKALAIGGAGGGLSDVTAGADLANGAKIPANHLLIIPRADGRGIVAETNAIVMVRGPHTIEKNN